MNVRRSLQALAIALCAAGPALAQTSAFTYQGRLVDAGTPADGTFQFQFRLFDTPAAGAGTPIGPVLTGLVVPVSGGLFTVTLDFGGGSFDGGARYLETGVRPNGGAGPYVILAPRQPITSTPYTVRSGSAAAADDAARLGGVAASQYVVTTDPRLTDARPPTPGSTSYVQNGTSPQASASFNVSGDGTAGGTLSASVVDAALRFDIGGTRVLGTAGSSNLFVGTAAGAANTSGGKNTFVGAAAGGANTTGVQNCYVGRGAGFGNTTGSNNTAMGLFAGAASAAANGTTFYGAFAGENNTASFNAFYGSDAGHANTTGDQNDFFGSGAGQANTTGFGNSFFGSLAGSTNVTGGNNSFFGADAGRTSTAGGNSFFGRSAGYATTTGSNNVFVGLDAGRFNATGSGDTFVGTSAGFNNIAGTNNTFIGFGAGTPDAATQITHSTAVGAFAVVTTNNTIVLGTSGDTVRVPGGLSVAGTLEALTLESNGQIPICQTAAHRFATCSSSLRYKTDVAPFAGGLALVQQLHPIRFTWKDGGLRDLGLGAEDVAQVEPLLVTRNAQGAIEGVKYDRVAVVLLNAVKEQQALIARLQERLAALERLAPGR
jgi:hypothetical protein